MITDHADDRLHMQFGYIHIYIYIYIYIYIFNREHIATVDVHDTWYIYSIATACTSIHTRSYLYITYYIIIISYIYLYRSRYLHIVDYRSS